MGLNVHDDIYNYLAAVQEEEFKKDYLESKMVDCIVSRNGESCQNGGSLPSLMSDLAISLSTASVNNASII